MLKKFILAVMIAVPGLMLAQTPKFGIVNAEEIISVMPEFTQAQEDIKKASQQYEEEYTKLEEELQKKYADFQQLYQDAATPDAIKERRLQEIQELDKKAQQFAQTAQQDIQRQQAQLLQPIQEKLIQTIKSVGANNGFTMIFPGEVPAYFSADVIDVTPMVKAALGLK